MLNKKDMFVELVVLLVLLIIYLNISLRIKKEFKQMKLNKYTLLFFKINWINVINNYANLINFIKKMFEVEINKENKIGTKGKLAKNYAAFIKGMWCDR